jgi:hypothetical protein
MALLADFMANNQSAEELYSSPSTNSSGGRAHLYEESVSSIDKNPARIAIHCVAGFGR